ncbi:MAG: molybdopterin synthase catalytic subunit MoaE [Alphaproteobacteria bacterium]|nr:molybdopterin synthase catalytic subunit MoaE [Alphaproteobacteria bacterium]
MSVSVQADDFDVGAEIKALSADRTDIGAVVTFTGLVRDTAGGESVADMELEHYPGMTEKMLADIESQARERWALDEILIIHRFGRLEPGDRIVLVATASAHRKAALESCEFLIDWLKTRAPFWKLEETGQGEHWVEARESDDEAAARWEEAPRKAAE